METAMLSNSSTLSLPNPSLSSSSPFHKILKPISLHFIPRTISHKTLDSSHTLQVRSTVKNETSEPDTEQPPDTFLRRSDDPDSTGNSVRSRFEKMIREVQGEICQVIEAVDGVGKFKEDLWWRAGGGGGISRVLQKGGVWEKAGVNVSVVYGSMPPEAYRAAKGEVKSSTIITGAEGPIPFFAAGISSVMHPSNPFAPTIHFNYRYFETDAPGGLDGGPKQWWFGGGTDLTPAYIFEEDAKHFHMVQKNACDKFDPDFYPRFKKWCDDYFFIEHRGERRGIGGIFYDDLKGYDQEMLLAFATECARSVVPAYIPIIERRKDISFTNQHKTWQRIRRGRYVEFNLIYDRGTTFGLKTGGRTESILVSLPLEAGWEYDHQPKEGSEEWKLLDVCINPREWI